MLTKWVHISPTLAAILAKAARDAAVNAQAPTAGPSSNLPHMERPASCTLKGKPPTAEQAPPDRRTQAGLGS